MTHVSLALLSALALFQAADRSGLAYELLTGERDPIRFDYGALRFDADDPAAAWDEMAALERQASRLAAPAGVRAGDRFDPAQSGCALPAVIGGLDLARRAPDAATYDAARERAIALFDAAAAELEQLTRRQSDPIERAVLRDRFWRDRMTRPRSEAGGTFASRFEADLYYRGLCLADLDNHALLSAMFERGEDVVFETVYASGRPERAALLQHASIDLRRRALAVLRSRPDYMRDPEGAGVYARLVDRVRLDEGRPQIYGTQYSCARGRALLAGRYDLAQIAENRAELGLAALDSGDAAGVCASRFGAEVE